MYRSLKTKLQGPYFYKLWTNRAATTAYCCTRDGAIYGVLTFLLKQKVMAFHKTATIRCTFLLSISEEYRILKPVKTTMTDRLAVNALYVLRNFKLLGSKVAISTAFSWLNIWNSCTIKSWLPCLQFCLPFISFANHFPRSRKSLIEMQFLTQLHKNIAGKAGFNGGNRYKSLQQTNYWNRQNLLAAPWLWEAVSKSLQEVMCWIRCRAHTTLLGFQHPHSSASPLVLINTLLVSEGQGNTSHRASEVTFKYFWI